MGGPGGSSPPVRKSFAFWGSIFTYFNAYMYSVAKPSISMAMEYGYSILLASNGAEP